MSVDLKIAPFENTPFEDIPKAVAEIRESYQSHKTRDIEWRLVQLRKLWWGLQDYSEKLQVSYTSLGCKKPLRHWKSGML